ncbi:MAG: hypothetical protein ACLR0F_07925 [Eisenbergiella sp.]
MNKKIVLTCLAAGILMCMLPAQKVNAAENQTAEDYYYQLLISGSYPYNTPANTGNAGAGVPVMPAGGWEQMVSLANQQLTQAVARQQALEATRQNLDGQLQAAAQAVVQAQAALTAAQWPIASALRQRPTPAGGAFKPAGRTWQSGCGKYAADGSGPAGGNDSAGTESAHFLWLRLQPYRGVRCSDTGGPDCVPD